MIDPTQVESEQNQHQIFSEISKELLQPLSIDETTQNELISILISGLSNNTKTSYLHTFNEFKQWQGDMPFTKSTVQAYKEWLISRGYRPASINLRLSAIRKLALEASDNKLLDPFTASAIGRVHGVKQAGKRMGNWLTKEQTQTLLTLPDRNTLKGKRDFALLGCLVGCGMRRSEVVSLKVSQIQQREGRWVVLDVIGKGNRVRTVPVPTWVYVALTDWMNSSSISDGYVFRSMRKGDNVSRESMSSQAVMVIVSEYGRALYEGTLNQLVTLRPHDLRRTFAKLALKGGAPLEQIQITLGHSSILTTERYLGVKQNLMHAPCDVVGVGV
ncbi:MAG TPA: tyrosine-type recombinase/integrase [Caldisericia bacterium]|nr:tyrosine-type recombinase/integrase [Caldisericia bacterium]HRV75670.1 tyrosine-type recombinase/integrase [Caldisericia bacterium]